MLDCLPVFIGLLKKKNNADRFPANVETSLKMSVTAPRHMGGLTNPQVTKSGSGGSGRSYRGTRERGGQKNQKQRERAVKNGPMSNGLENKVGIRSRGPEKQLNSNTNKPAGDHFDSRKDLKQTTSSAQSVAPNYFRQNMQVTTDTVVQKSKNAFSSEFFVWDRVTTLYSCFI